MVAVGSLLILLSLIGLLWKRLVKKDRFPKWLMWLFVMTGPLAVLGIEFGWIFACTGRQPWTIYRMLATEDSATTATNLGILFILFVIVYAILAFSVVFVLRYYFRKNTVQADLSRAEQKDVPLYGSNT
jgi:cytochrome bd ubiquinol oxidase subunit I